MSDAAAIGQTKETPVEAESSDTMVNAGDSTTSTKVCDKEDAVRPDSVPETSNDVMKNTSQTSTCEDKTDDQHQTSNQCNLTDLENLAVDCERLKVDQEGEKDRDSSQAETRSGVKLLRSWLNKNIKVEISDGRFLVGVFLCTDRDSNVIIGLCNEYTRDPDLRIPQPHSTLSAATSPLNHGGQSRDTAASSAEPENVVFTPGQARDAASADFDGVVFSSTASSADSMFQEEGRILGLAMVPGRHIKKLYIDDSPLVPASSRANTDTSSEGSCHST